ncbi:MAG: acyl-CoA thioesterase [Burkholderiales bacterium]
MAFEESFAVAWSHLDGNGHMANTAYMLIAIDCRFHYFASRGVAPADFARWRIGPAVRHDELDYYREMHFMQQARVNLAISGLAPDASRFRLVNEIRRPDGELAARVTSLGGWLDLEARKLVAPPAPLAEALRELEQLPGFEVLPSSVR